MNPTPTIRPPTLPTHPAGTNYPIWYPYQPADANMRFRFVVKLGGLVNDVDDSADVGGFVNNADGLVNAGGGGGKGASNPAAVAADGIADA